MSIFEYKSECARVRSILRSTNGGSISTSDAARLDDHCQKCSRCEAERRFTVLAHSAAEAICAAAPISTTTFSMLPELGDPYRFRVSRTYRFILAVGLCSAVGAVLVSVALIGGHSRDRHADIAVIAADRNSPRKVVQVQGEPTPHAANLSGEKSIPDTRSPVGSGIWAIRNDASVASLKEPSRSGHVASRRASSTPVVLSVERSRDPVYNEAGVLAYERPVFGEAPSVGSPLSAGQAELALVSGTAPASVDSASTVSLDPVFVETDRDVESQR